MTLPTRYQRLRRLEKPPRKAPRIDPAEFGLVVTVCIAAISYPPTHIVTVSDKMLSDLNDQVAARDGLVTKDVGVTKKWGIMWAGNSELWPEFFADVSPKLLLESPAVNSTLVNDTTLRAYNSIVERRFMAGGLARLGFVSIDDFTQRARDQLGQELFDHYVSKLEQFNLDIEFVVYGFDEDGTAHVMALEHPGIVTEHAGEGFMVAGSGTYMARAALHRRPPRTNLMSTIYGLLDAKFSAETAAGVGKETYLRVLGNYGAEWSLASHEIDSIREAWLEERKRPDPSSALKVIRDAFSAHQASDIEPPSFD
jgi:hypothetical protein